MWTLWANLLCHHIRMKWYPFSIHKLNFKASTIYTHRPACMLCFLKEQGHQGIFTVVKGTLYEDLSISTGTFQRHHGQWPKPKGHGGNRLRCLCEDQACTHTCYHQAWYSAYFIVFFPFFFFALRKKSANSWTGFLIFFNLSELCKFAKK